MAALVHCSDGWDRTSQLVGLVVLLNDPAARTMRGFAQLVEAQFVAFGHQFAVRQGWFVRGSDNECAPIFQLFVECVFQLLEQFPTAFEFTDDYLLALMDGLDSLAWGTFLANEKGRLELDLVSKTLSIWRSLCDPQYANRSYAPSQQQQRLVPSTLQRKLRLWRKFYLRYAD